MNDALELMDEWGPEKIVCVSDSRTGMRGVLVIDNTARGMGKGGTRMSPTVSVAEVARLARVMTWKWAGVDLFFGGAKAGIQFDPHDSRKEDVLRAFVRALCNEIPAEYVFGLDMGLTEEDAAIVQDEARDRGAAVGTPAALGGVPYDELGVTGLGVAEATAAAASVIGLPLASSRIAVQGFGAVASATAGRLIELGATVVSVSTAKGALHDAGGLDIRRLLDLKAEVGDDCVYKYEGGKQIALGDELLIPCDIAIPAALQDTIDLGIAKRMNVKLVVEGANLPTSVDAQKFFAATGTTLVPDFIANAGGIVAAAFAMDARYSPFPPDPDVIKEFVKRKIRANVETVLSYAKAMRMDEHSAARDLSQQRVSHAMRLKGRQFIFDGKGKRDSS